MEFKLQGPKAKLYLAVAALCCFLFGMLIGYLVTPTDYSGTGESSEITKLPSRLDILTENKWKKEENMIPKILERINSDNIRENLRYLSKKPHLAATPRDNELAVFIRDKFLEAGLDSSELVPYNVYLSRPNSTRPNTVTLYRNGERIFQSSARESTIHPDDEDKTHVDAFNAFTPAGTVSTETGIGVVYVNYGRLEDFQRLKDFGIDVSGHIALIRYGVIYRGSKVKNAEMFGATGVILYSDPADVAAEGTSSGDVYDNSFWLPGTGIQRGGTHPLNGDPLTPGWPSTEHAYRISRNESVLAKIPSQPIGYNDAEQILERLGGNVAPPDWQGGLPITYNLGPNFNYENRDVSLTLSTHNIEKTEKSFNVIGVIQGSIEPDRYVLIGNHRDSWGFGGVDASTGTAQLLETVRVFGTLLEEGWRPRRSLVFCSWGAEEYGLIGSTEWVEENIEKLKSRAVAYINTDICAAGPALTISASPLMQNVFLQMTKLVPGVQDSAVTLFEEWEKYSRELRPETLDAPIINPLGSGSDFAPFSIVAGIPAADIFFRTDQVKYKIPFYPAYHTGYETFHLVSNYIDPEFKIQQGCGRLAFLSLKFLADSLILPYSIQRLPKMMSNALQNSKYRSKLMQIDDNFNELENSVNVFSEATRKFQRKLEQRKNWNFIESRAVNDQLMRLEQIFTIPEGIPGRPTVRNAIFANSQFDYYASDTFPGITSLIYEFEKLINEEKEEREKQIKHHISDLIIMTDRATAFLNDFSIF